MVGVLEEMTEEMKTEEKTGRRKRLSCRQALLALLRQLRSGQLSTTVDLGMDSKKNWIRLEMPILDKVDRRLLDLVRRMLQAMIRPPIQDMDLLILAVDLRLGCRWRQEEEASVDHHLVDRRFQALGHLQELALDPASEDRRHLDHRPDLQGLEDQADLQGQEGLTNVGLLHQLGHQAAKVIPRTEVGCGS